MSLLALNSVDQQKRTAHEVGVGSKPKLSLISHGLRLISGQGQRFVWGLEAFTIAIGPSQALRVLKASPKVEGLGLVETYTCFCSLCRGSPGLAGL